MLLKRIYLHKFSSNAQSDSAVYLRNLCGYLLAIQTTESKMIVYVSIFALLIGSCRGLLIKHPTRIATTSTTSVSFRSRRAYITTMATASSVSMKVNSPKSSIANTKKRPNILNAVGTTLSVLIATWCVRAFSKQFVATKAAAKFTKAGGWRGIYATIPIISGLLNLATNKLAVWMIFSPIEFVGKALWPRQEGQPGTLFGWQGIVPAKVKKMGGDIADLLLNQLLDIKAIFSRLDSVRLAKLLTPRLTPTVSAITKQEFFGSTTWDLGEGWNEIYDGVIKQKTESIMIRIVSQVRLLP